MATVAIVIVLALLFGGVGLLGFLDQLRTSSGSGF